MEVLSDSAARTDRHEKLNAYKLIPSLKTYLIVSQQAMHATLHRRDNDWQPEIFTQPEDALKLDCGAPHTPLTMTAIYESVLDS